VNHSLALTPQGDVNGLTFYSASQPINCTATSGDRDLSIHVQTGKINQAQHIWAAAASGYLVTP
jgi:hypothetical protein